MASFDDFLGTLSLDKQVRGKQFERVCKWLLETDPTYTNKLKNVWLWDDWPGNRGRDLGIDLIAEEEDGRIWAVQAKCYDAKNSISKSDVDSFVSESSNPKISRRLLIATTDNIGPNALSVIGRANESIPVNQLLLTELQEKPLVWPESLDDLSTGGAQEPFNPKPERSVLKVEVISLRLGPRFDISDFSENAFAFGDSYFGEVAMLQDCLSGFSFADLGSWSGAQPTMDSAAEFPLYRWALTLATAPGFCEATPTRPVDTKACMSTIFDQLFNVTLC